MEQRGIEHAPPSAPIVAEGREEDADPATKRDVTRREVSASEDVVEAAFAKALAEASAAGRFDVVALLAGELQARRLARSGVATLAATRKRRGA